MSVEALGGSPLDRLFKSRQPRLAGNVHAFLRAPTREFDMGQTTSTSSREEAFGGADMTLVRNIESGLGASTVARGQSGVTGSGSEGVGAREVERKENRERGGNLHGPTIRFYGSVQESLNSEGVLQAI